MLLEKSQRKPFGPKGVRGIYLGLSQKHADWTFIVYIPSTDRTLFHRDILFNEHSMPFRDARHQLGRLTGVNHYLRRGVGQFSRSILRDTSDTLHLTHGLPPTAMKLIIRLSKIGCWFRTITAAPFMSVIRFSLDTHPPQSLTLKTRSFLSQTS